jgi:hemolysin activation/secretion protein
MAGGQPMFASLDYGHVCGLNTAALVGARLAGTVIGVRGDARTRIGALAYDLFFAGKPIYKPADFPTVRCRWRPADRSILGE